MSDAQIRRDLEAATTHDFQTSRLYRRVFELADQASATPVPRAMLPRILLQSPKITRKLTTDWFANRVDERQRRCLARAEKAVGA